LTRCPRDSAFSLIEILAALAIFGLCIVALIEGISQTLANWRLAEEKTQALMLCENRMQEILADPVLEVGDENESFEAPDERYSWSSVVDATEIPSLYSVSVSVIWLSSGKEQDVFLTTLRLQRPEERVSEPATTPGGMR